MAQPFAATLELHPRPSRVLNLLLVLAHGLALLLICWLAWRFALWLLLVPLVGGSAVYYLRRNNLPYPARIIRLLWSPEDEWTLHLQSGESLGARLLPSTVVTRALVILHFRAHASRRFLSLWLPVDTLPADTHRRLRARLRMHGAAKGSDNDGSPV